MDNKIRNLSLVISSTVYSLFYVWFFHDFLMEAKLPYIYTASIRIIIGLFGLIFCYNYFSKLFYTFYGRRFIGEWPYKSDGGNFAIAKIRATPSGMHYTVDLYHSAEEVLSALDQKPEVDPFARAHDIMSQFKENQITFIYSIDFTTQSFPKRKGMLELIPDPTNPSKIKGYWETTLSAAEKRCGGLSLYKPEAFRKAFGQPAKAS
ncbi:hypothetical protein [Solidesulfovibrio sp.]